MLFNYDISKKQKNMIIKNLLLARGYSKKFISNYFKLDTLVLSNGCSRIYLPVNFFGYDKQIFIERFNNLDIKCFGTVIGNEGISNNTELYCDKFIQIFNIYNRVVRSEYNVIETTDGYVAKFLVTYCEIDENAVYHIKLSDLLNNYYNLPYKIYKEFEIPITEVNVPYNYDINALIFNKYSEDVVNAIVKLYEKVEELFGINFKEKKGKKRTRKITDLI